MDIFFSVRLMAMLVSLLTPGMFLGEASSPAL
jgi:hypothetical protein